MNIPSIRTGKRWLNIYQFTNQKLNRKLKGQKNDTEDSAVKKIRLSNGIRKYIRHQKMMIREVSKTDEEAKRLIKELLGRFYPSARKPHL